MLAPSRDLRTRHTTYQPAFVTSHFTALNNTTDSTPQPTSKASAPHGFADTAWTTTPIRPRATSSGSSTTHNGNDALVFFPTRVRTLIPIPP